MLGGVELGVQIVGSELGLKSTLSEAVASANAWADATEAAGVKAARGIELVGVAARQAEIAYGKMGIAVSRFGEDTVAAQAAAVRYESTVSGLYDRQIAQANVAAAAQERAALRYQTSLTNIGRGLTTYVTLPLAAAGYAAIKLATDFQASMTRVQTYAGASAKEVKTQSENILNSAGSLPQGPVKAAEALYHLESIGIRGARALEALKSASLAAGAGQANLTDATTALGGALVSNIKGAQDTKQAMANLVAIAGQGNMTLQNLTDAMGTGLLVKAGNVGISLHEVGAALDVLVDRGIPARRAATYLGTTFALMVAPSQSAKAAADDLGVSWEKMGSMLQQPGGLLKVLEMFHERVQAVGMTKGMRDVMDMFGRSRQSTGIQTLIESFNAPVSSYAQKLAQTDKATKDSLKTLEEYQKTAQYKMHTALSQLEADFIKLGDGVKGPVAEALGATARSIDDIVNAFDKLPRGAREAIGALAGIAAVIGPLALFAGGMMKVSRATRQVFVDLGIIPKATAAAAAGAEVPIAGMQAAMLGLETSSSDLKASFAALPAEARASLDAMAAEFAMIPVSAREAAAEAALAFSNLPPAAREAALASVAAASAPFAEFPAAAREAVGAAAATFAELPVEARAAAVSSVLALRMVTQAIAEESPLVDTYTAEAAANLRRLPIAAREAVAEMASVFNTFSVAATADLAEIASTFSMIPAAAREAALASAGAFAALPAELKTATAEAAASYAVLPPAAREAVVASAAAFAEFPAEVRASAASAVMALAELPIAAREAAVRSSAALSEIAVDLPAETRVAAAEAAAALEALPAEARFASANMVAAFADLVPGAREAAVGAAAAFAALPREAREAAMIVAESFNGIPIAAREAAVRTMAAFAELPVEMRVQFSASVAAAAEELAGLSGAARETATSASLSFSQLSDSARRTAVTFADVADENVVLQQVTQKTTTAVEELTAALNQVGPAAAEGAATADAALGSIGSTAGKAGAEVEAMDLAVAAPGVGRLSGMIGGTGKALMGGGLFAMGGMIAGGMVQSMVGGEGGHIAGDVLTGAGVGAGAGILAGAASGALFGTELGPAGTVAGAALGALAFGLKDLVHAGPSFEQTMSSMSNSVEGLGMAARSAAGNVTQLHARVADLRVSRDRLQQQLKSDQAAFSLNPSTTNRDQVIADLAQIQAYDQQISASNSQIGRQEQRKADDLRKQKEQLQGIVEKTQNLSDVGLKIIGAGAKTSGQSFFQVGDQLVKIGSETDQAKTKLQAYEKATQDMAENSKGKLQEVYYKLHDIAVQTNNIPTNHQVKIVVDAVYTDAAKGVPGFLSGLDALARGLSNDIQGMFKGIKPANVPGYKTPPLSREQSIQVQLAQNPNNRAAIEGQIKYDQGLISEYKKQRAEGKIGPQQYVDLITAAYQDLNQMKQQLSSMKKSGSSAASKAQSAFEKKVRSDEMLSKARLDLENGQYAAAEALLRKDKARLELLLKEAKTQDERITVQKQLLEVERAMKQKASGFTLPMSLQVAMARADALAALSPDQAGPTAMQTKLAREAKAQAMKAINGHHLAMQGLIDAWGIVGQANSVLAQRAVNQANLYHTVSTDTIADSIKGLSATQEMQLREELAQRDAHRGQAPNDQGAPSGNPTGSGGTHDGRRPHPPGPPDPGPVGAKGTVININGPMTFQGVQNVRQLEGELEKLRRQKHSRAGSRR